MDLRKIDMVAFVFVMIGCFNLGIYGLFNFSLINYLLAEPWVQQALYTVIGFSSVYLACAWSYFHDRWTSKRG